MCTRNITQGFSLIELLLVLTVIAATLTIGLPALANFNANIKARNDISELRLILSHARSASIQHVSRSKLCPLNSSGKCTNRWNQKLTLFLDRNNNDSLDAGETTLGQLDAITTTTVQRSFTGSSVSFNGQGMAGINTGSFGYCLQASRPLSASFIISRIGRIRPGIDSNNNGIKETASGQDVPCP